MVHSSERLAHPKTVDKPESKPGLVLWLYRLIALGSGLFIFTIFVMCAVTMADPRAGNNQQLQEFFDSNGLRIIAVEVTAILGLVAIAFVLDRRASWQKYRREYAEWEARMQERTVENLRATAEVESNAGENP